MKKRLRALAWVLTLAMLCQVLPLAAFAQAGTGLSGAVQALLDEENGIVASGTCGAEGDNLTWTLDDAGTLTISGTGAMEDWNGEHFAPWLSWPSRIIHVVVEKGVTNISKEAFSFCTKLADITIPDGVTSIGYGAFWHCSSLTEIAIPSSVRSIDSHAFLECTSLSKISVADGNPYYRALDGVLFNRNKTQLICYPAGKTDSQYEIPNGVTDIGDCAFYYNRSLIDIAIPYSVTSIGGYAFCGCSSLTEITIPYGIIKIKEYTFSGCENLARIMLLAKIKSIGDDAFIDCGSLRYVYYIGAKADWDAVDKGFGNECLTSATIYCSDMVLEAEPSDSDFDGGAILLVGVAAAAAAAVAAVVLMMPVQIQGRVAFADDTAVPGAKITLTKHGKTVAETTADADGAFTLKAARGKYELLVSYMDAEGRIVQNTTAVKAPVRNTVIRF